MSQYLMVVLFLLMPIEVTASPPSQESLDNLKQGMIQVEIDTRAYRQRRSGGGL